MAWSPDSKQILTASGDKTCRLWDVETRAVVTYAILSSQRDVARQCDICITL